MDTFILCIAGAWKYSENGKWEFELMNDEVARTVRLDGIHTYQQMIEKIFVVFHVDVASHKFTLMYQPLHLSKVCTQTRLSPVAIETDDDVHLFYRICSSHDGMNMTVSWEPSWNVAGSETIGEIGNYGYEVCYSDENDIDDDELVAYIEEVENEYLKGDCAVAKESKREGKRVLIDNDNALEVGKRPLKRQALLMEQVNEVCYPPTHCFLLMYEDGPSFHTKEIFLPP